MERLRVERNYSLKSMSRIKTGGDALYYASPQSIEDLRYAIQIAGDQNMPFYIIGAGTNLLINDAIIKGIVIKLSKEFSTIEFDSDRGMVTAGAATSLIKLGFHLARCGHSGFSFMAVIPGSVGGAVRMNAGTSRDGEIKDSFLKAEVLDPETLEVLEYDLDRMCFGHRDSVLSRKNAIILNATFMLRPMNERDTVTDLRSIRELQTSRRQKFPKNPRTFGSTFKRPDGGKPAGWYLDRVGMKGFRVGDAVVPEEHANWIVNIGRARSDDVKAIIHTAQERVFNEFGVRLSREVVFMPEDMAW